MLLGKSLTICSIFCVVSHSIRIHRISSYGGAMLLVILAFVQLSYLLSNGYRPNIQSKLALKCIWKLNVISNIQVFVLRLVLKRLKTRDKLAIQGVFSSVHRLVCPLCFGQEKNHCHWFLYCSVVIDVSNSILDWIDLCRLGPWVDIT